MARPARTTRERMLDATELLLRERGLSGAGIHHVIARSGTPIGSLYHFFPGGKTQLVAEALRLHGLKAGELLQTVLRDTSAPPAERVRRLFRTAAAGFDRAGADKGCAIGAVALDLDARQESLREVCQEAFDAWIASIADVLPWSERAARRGFAHLLVAALEGAFVLGRARRSGQPFIAVGESLALMLERRPPHADKRTRATSTRRRPRRANRVK